VTSKPKEDWGENAVVAQSNKYSTSYPGSSLFLPRESTLVSTGHVAPKTWVLTRMCYRRGVAKCKIVTSVSHLFPYSSPLYSNVVLFVSLVPFLYHLCTPIVPPLYPSCTPCTLLYSSCTPSVPLLYPLCTLPVPPVYPYCTPLMHFFALEKNMN